MTARRVVFGVGPVRELLARRAHDVACVYVSPARKARGQDPVAVIAADARRRGVTVIDADRAELDALAGPGARHQGAVAIAGAYVYADADDLVDRARSAQQPALIAILDGVTDPHNLGAIVRSAHVLGADGLIIPRDRAASVTATVTKASAGATEYLPIAQVTNLARALGDLKDAGLWLIAIAATPDATPLDQLDAGLLTGPVGLVLGAEGRGIRRLVARACDVAAQIPMAGAGVGSLNVSVAAGIALYEVARRRTRR